MSVTITCSECGIGYCLPDHFYRTRKRDHGTFHCPNGHRQHFPGQSEEEKLRAENQRLRESVSYWEGRTHAAREAHEHALRMAWGYKGAMRKAQREAGIIPFADADAA
jgi:hypothetical protein